MAAAAGAPRTNRDASHFKRKCFYLANLCHDCRACYYACMFTPPHEFAINIPQILAQSRMETYRRWSWPDFLGRAFKNRSVTVFLATAMAALIAVLALLFIPSETVFTAHVGPGAFYEVVPYLAMVVGALILFFYGIAVWMRGGARFWSETRTALNEQGGAKAILAAIGAALGLRLSSRRRARCFYSGRAAVSVAASVSSLTFWGLAGDLFSHDARFRLSGFHAHSRRLRVDQRAGNFRHGGRRGPADRDRRTNLLPKLRSDRDPERRKRMAWTTFFWSRSVSRRSRECSR